MVLMKAEKEKVIEKIKDEDEKEIIMTDKSEDESETETVEEEKELPVFPEKRCTFCENEALFIGTFKSEWFNLNVQVCKQDMARMINQNIELEDLKNGRPEAAIPEPVSE